MQKNKFIKFTFRMREDVHSEVKARAKKEGISLNSALHQMVVRDLENNKRRETNA
ncbi:toxin-antitoxin system HicB family antitoxin [Gilliamella sp. Nev5-1]|uniref:toxin-antitoxin system HicB family antitoxin n=1 Tax=Gilliamella sp. Nev5-1 TaxID=3120251 RepID=UPI0009E42D7C|nr:toxin-antitoxin system HicB family antitoxin [Gilliamella apicola]